MNNETIEKPALDVLLDHNLHDLVQSTAAQFYRTYGGHRARSIMITTEDLATEGYVGITVAYESFDPRLGATDDVFQSFRTYVYPYMKNAMLTYCRKFGHSLSISEKSARTDYKELLNISVLRIDQRSDDNDGGDDEGDPRFEIPVGSGVEPSGDVEDFFFTGFTEFERSLVRDHIIEGYSLQEVSDRHGLSKSRTGEILRTLTDRMKARAEEYVKTH